MKQWNTPEIAALDINQTENGLCLPWHEKIVVVETPCVDIVIGVPGHGTIDCGEGQQKGGGEEVGTKGPGDTSGTGDTNSWS